MGPLALESKRARLARVILVDSRRGLSPKIG